MRNHPVAAFVVPFLEYLDRQQVESTIYYNAMATDSVTDMAGPGRSAGAT